MALRLRQTRRGIYASCVLVIFVSLATDGPNKNRKVWEPMRNSPTSKEVMEPVSLEQLIPKQDRRANPATSTEGTSTPKAEGSSSPEAEGSSSPEADKDVTSEKAPGQIWGRVELLSGDVLPNVSVKATSLARTDKSFVTSTEQITDEEGVFRFPELPQGFYKIEVHPNIDSPDDWVFPIQGGDTFGTGDDLAIVAIDAFSVRMPVATDAPREDLPASVNCTQVSKEGYIDLFSPSTNRGVTYLEGDEEDRMGTSGILEESIATARGDEQPRLNPQEASIGFVEFLLPATHSYLFSTRGGAYETTVRARPAPLYGFLSADAPSGKIDILLSRTPSSLGSIQLNLDHPALQDSARFSVKEFVFNGANDPFPDFDSASAMFGHAELRFDGLMPGTYVIQTELENSDLLRMASHSIEIYVTGGASETREVLATEWAALLVTANPSHPPGPHSFASVRLQHPGQTTWHNIILHSPEPFPGGHRALRASAVTVGGPTGTSDPLPPGEYRLRITLPGHAAQERAVTLRPGDKKQVTFTMQPQ
jgi:hypothetical protein